MIPGPFATESRCAPRSTVPALRPGRSAITFAARARRLTAETETRSRTVSACNDRSSSEPSVEEIISTGMPMPGPPSVAAIGATRPVPPSFAISAALAPAAFAFRAFWVKKQVPRRIRAIAPEGKRAKSDCWQPLAADPGTETTWPVTVPPPE